MIDFSLPKVTNREIQAVTEILRSKWLTTGYKTQAFAQAINSYVGSKYCVCLSSCTAALHVALVCAGVKEGDEVITTPMTFVSTINTILYLKAKPVFVDIKPNDFILNEALIESKITKKTKAIVAVHYGGFSANLNTLRKLCKKYNLELVEDAAHALGTLYKDEQIGKNSKFCCLSFYPTKNITTIEGGALLTNSEEVYKRASSLGLHGISRDSWKRYSKDGSWRYDVSEIGFKYNMTDIEAAVGLAQLESINSMKKHRDTVAKLYKQHLTDIPGLEILDGNKYSKPFRHLFVIKTNSPKITRDEFIEKMKKEDIICSVHFIPVYHFSIYKKLFSFKPKDFPETEKAFASCVSLPFGSYLKLKDAMRVVEITRKILQ